MSGSKDELKDLFESAFAAESVPFSDNAWADMNAMLNKRNKKGAFWYWLAGIATTGLTILALIPFFSNANQEYRPRLSNITFESVGTQTALPETAVSNQKAKTQISELVASTSEDTSEERLDPKDIETSSIANSQPSSKSGTTPNRTTHTSRTNSGTDQGAIAIQNQTPSTNDVSASTGQPLVDAGNEKDDSELAEIFREDLSVMNSLTLEFKADSNIKHKTRRLLPPYFVEDRWDYYMLFGLSKSSDLSSGMYQGTGQRLGGGLTYKFRDHIYFSSELSLARDAVNIVNEQTFTYYGFGKENYTVQSGTYEMINLNIPVMAHYRWNRWNVGGGIFFDYLSSMKIEETSTKNSTQESVVLQDGYFRWNQYRSMNFGLAMDAQYQLSEKFFIGARSSFGFMDLTKADLPVRKNRTEVYIKYLLNQ